MLTFVTSNPQKVQFAKQALAPFGLEIKNIFLELEELQSDDPKVIITRKAQDAFTKIQTPVVVSDHSWEFAALNGFPGPYMHFINDHLRADDLLRLMEGKTDRRAILHEYICYCDGRRTRVFSEDISGVVLTASEGDGVPGQQIISLSGDNHSIAYHINHDNDPRGDSPRKVWEDLAVWYQKQ